MQPRFDRRVGKTPYKLLEHPRLRAGYDFLLLRCASGEIDSEIGEWWTDFMEADGSGREELLAKKPAATSTGTATAPAKKRRRRGGRSRGAGESGSTNSDTSGNGE
jgi:poly(A) polymerase